MKVLKKLLEHDGVAWLADNQKRYPVNLAAKAGNLEAVKLLLQNGASVWQSDGSGRFPIHEAARSGKLYVYLFTSRTNIITYEIYLLRS